MKMMGWGGDWKMKKRIEFSWKVYIIKELKSSFINSILRMLQFDENRNGKI